MRQDSEPAERILSFVYLDLTGGDRWTAHSARAVATGDEVAGDFTFVAVLVESEYRASLYPDILHVKVERTSSRAPRGDQVLYDLVLAIDGDGPSTRQLFEIDAMTLSAEADIDTVVPHPLAAQ